MTPNPNGLTDEQVEYFTKRYQDLVEEYGESHQAPPIDWSVGAFIALSNLYAFHEYETAFSYLPDEVQQAIKTLLATFPDVLIGMSSLSELSDYNIN